MPRTFSELFAAATLADDTELVAGDEPGTDEIILLFSPSAAEWLATEEFAIDAFTTEELATNEPATEELSSDELASDERATARSTVAAAADLTDEVLAWGMRPVFELAAPAPAGKATVTSTAFALALDRCCSPALA